MMAHDDDPIRLTLGLSNAVREAGIRLRDNDPLAVTLAEQASKAFSIANHPVLAEMAAQQTMFARYLREDERLREIALAMTTTLVPQSIIEAARETAMIPRLAIGPLAELRDAGMFSAQQKALENSMLVSSQMLEAFEAGFKVPSAIEAARLAAETAHSAMARALATVAPPTSVLAAMEQMRHPWLDIANPLASSASFAAIQEMANAVRVAPAFDFEVTRALRVKLGDWRDEISFPSEIYSDLQARSAFYSSLGVDAALTVMPAPAFREAVVVAGLVDILKSEEAQDVDGTETVDEEELAFGRTNEAHDLLQRLEVQMRRFIEAVLMAEHGQHWVKRSVPQAMREAWQEKQEKSEKASETRHPLIFFADFTDYVPIIVKGDNWKLFAPYFDRAESVRESLQRLYPIRNDTMHSRMITQDDELFLLVEYKRLTKAIRKFSQRRTN
ncbi:MAG: Swt1 family HEPN domain-containing protein [Acidobacteria bacterium]|jgi:hypothetical protein|nr:Swt1 family HEPN domain-containing protein [Acidobacteriota bacterium]